MRANDERQAGPGDAHDEQGSALVLVLIMIVMLTGVTLVLAEAARSQKMAGQGSRERAAMLAAADVGIGKGLAALLAMSEEERLLLPEGSGWTTLVGGADVTATQNDAWVQVQRDGTRFRIRSYGVGGVANEELRAIELVAQIEEDERPGIKGAGAGAIVGLGGFATKGTIDIDGNDYDMEGNLRTDANARHSPAFVTTGEGSAISIGGNSKVAGGGNTTFSKGTEGESIDTDSTVWVAEDTLGNTNPSRNDAAWDADGYDNDDDGEIDEDDEGDDRSGWASDSYDNDGDGIDDEDGFPMDPGALVGATAAELKSAAIAGGTYFRKNGNTLEQHDGTSFTGVTYASWVASADAADGGDIVVLEGPDDTDFGQVDLPNNGASGKPSMFVAMNQEFSEGSDAEWWDHNTAIGPVHVAGASGTYLGAFTADRINKFNSNDTIRGGIFAYGNITDDGTDDGEQNSTDNVGNGSATIQFSSEALGNLPRPTVEPVPPLPRISVWRELGFDDLTTQRAALR